MPAEPVPSAASEASAEGALPAALLLDFDGTTVDSEDNWGRAEQRLIAELGGPQPPDREIPSMVGFAIVDTAGTILEVTGRTDLDVEQYAQVITDYALEDCLATGVPLLPGVADLLTEARASGVPCALVSATFQASLDAIAATWPEAYFDLILGGDRVEHSKPHPEPYLTAARELGVDPADCVVVEDSPTGAASGLAAGCVVVGVPNKAPLDGVPVHATWPSLDGVRLADLSSVWRGVRQG